jgi:hypothetical protein
MKAQQVRYDRENDVIEPTDDPPEQDWAAVCERFDDDVQRVRDVHDRLPYTALYVCFDPDNRPVHFLVQEDRQLNKLRHKVFYSKLGKEG